MRKVFEIDKQKIAMQLCYAVRKGAMKKADYCYGCEKTTIPRNFCGHHPDYTKPYNVIWLCRGCHNKSHGFLTNPKFKHYGKDNNKTKLTPLIVMEIREEYNNGETSQRKLAQKHKVSKTAIRDILIRKNWGWLS